MLYAPIVKIQERNRVQLAHTFYMLQMYLKSCVCAQSYHNAYKATEGSRTKEQKHYFKEKRIAPLGD